MNRKTFLASLGAALAAPFVTKLPAAQDDSVDKLIASMRACDKTFAESSKSIEALTREIEKRKKQVGYISIDHCPEGTSFINDWDILMDEPFDQSRKIQRCHDIEGWYEYLTYDNPYQPIHVKAQFKVVYVGGDPRYAAFKPV